MSSTADRFFVEKIEQGLGPLTELEKTVLLTPVTDIERVEGFSPNIVPSLNAKGARGLTIAYKQDTSGKNKKAGLVWNEHNEFIYKHSECAISGIVQNWYLSEGRPLEKKIFGFFGNPDW
jgi:hypothetical protein